MRALLALLVSAALAADSAIEERDTNDDAGDEAGADADADAEIADVDANDLDARDRVSTGRHSTRGIYDVETAEALPPGMLALGAAGEFFRTQGFLSQGDTHTRVISSARLAFSPTKNLDFGLSWSSILNSNPSLLREGALTLGDPRFITKVTGGLGSKLRLGLLIGLRTPTSNNGMTMEFGATSIDAVALASYTLPSVTLALNFGYSIDNSANIFPNGIPYTISSVVRFNAGVSRTNAVLLKFGAEGNLNIVKGLSTLPYLELSSAFGQGVSSGENPMLFGVGLKTLAIAGDLLKIALGFTFRLSGEPKDNGKFPGQPPWEANIGVGLNVPVMRNSKALAASTQNAGASDDMRPCRWDMPCPKGATCSYGFCVPDDEKEDASGDDGDKAVPTFMVAGLVTNAQTKAPLRNASVKVSGFEGTVISTGGDGSFQTWPLPVDDGLLRITIKAPGFKTATQTIPKGPQGTTKKITVALIPSTGKDLPGKIRGRVTDAANGGPLPALLMLPTLGKQVVANSDGTFEIELDVGSYAMIISAPKYETQKKQIAIASSEVVILNIEMIRKQRWNM